MNVEYLIQLLNNKLVVLQNAKTQAVMSGDLVTINSIDEETLGVQNTLAQLRLVQQISTAAAAANTTTAQVVASGVTSVQTAGTLPDNPTEVLSMYDMSTYAADPLYYQKLTDILSIMPIMDTTQEIDTYIANEAIGSPLNGQMILGLAQQYSIDTRMLMAILELESNFGTAGLAVSTINPGNVGNTGTSTRTYNSWQDGVAAVAQWLSVHPAIAATPVVTTPIAATISTASTTATTTPSVATATSTQSTASTVLTATSTPVITTPPFVDTTPIINASSTSASSTTATTTLASTTPPIDPTVTASSTSATSTLDTLPPDTLGGGNASSTNATSTFATSTDTTASSSTLPIDPTAPAVNATSTVATTTPAVDLLNATSTDQVVSASSTAAFRFFPSKRRRKI